MILQSIAKTHTQQQQQQQQQQLCSQKKKIISYFLQVAICLAVKFLSRPHYNQNANINWFVCRLWEISSLRVSLLIVLSRKRERETLYFCFDFVILNYCLLVFNFCLF
jgi:hypothetical protein